MFKAFIPAILVILIYHYWGDIPVDWVEGLLRDWAEGMQRTRELRLDPSQAVA